MNVDFIELTERIRQELLYLSQAISRAERANNAARQQRSDADLFFDSVALNLHAFYTGLERIFHQIVTFVDRSVPTGSKWHYDLLKQMCVELPGVRPRVLSYTTCQALEEFLRFRHLVRNIYAFQLNGDRINLLVREARGIADQVAGELEVFATFLEQVGQEE